MLDAHIRHKLLEMSIKRRFVYIYKIQGVCVMSAVSEGPQAAITIHPSLFRSLSPVVTQPCAVISQSCDPFLKQSHASAAEAIIIKWSQRATLLRPIWRRTSEIWTQ
jgi:hypothetical protein